MRFLHAADLHLGQRVTRFGEHVNGRVQEARLEALDRLVAEAKKHAVEFLLIAGDLFDDNRVDAATARRAYKILSEANDRPVYVISGNHDPLTVDSVFCRPPWNQDDARVCVLRSAQPVAIPGGTLFPCPLFAKTSFDDPTRWIPPRTADTAVPQAGGIRIGLAHGSLNDREHLPADDHLIDRWAADEKGLDYLALGHWHGPYRAKDRAGVVRTVYPGVHEPMGFHDHPEFSIGWSAYSNTTRTDLFTDDGRGRVLVVTIERAGAAPVIEEVETGRLQWRDESYMLRNEQDLGKLIQTLATRENQDRQLLRLHLSGVLSASAIAQLDELGGGVGGAGGVLTRFLWHELDRDQLFTSPTDEELQELAGDGVVRAVFDRLKEEEKSTEPATQQLAREALVLLYRFAQEVRR